MALDDLDDRFAAAVKLALDASRTPGDDRSDAADDAGCPSSDVIASYYEYALSRVERARLEAHFSGCARCQGTLAALLRAAPMVDSASEAGGFAAAATRKAAAESAGIRERWFEVSPPWRIAGVTAVATAMLVVVVVAGVRVYQGRVGQESEQIAAVSSAPLRNHRHKKAHSASNETELTLNDSDDNHLANRLDRLDKKSSALAAPSGPKAPAAPLAGVPPAATGEGPARSSAGAAAGPSNAPGEAAPPSQEIAPPIAPANTDQNAIQNGGGAATAAQAAAALGALAATPATPAPAAPGNTAPANIAPTNGAPAIAATAAAASAAAAAMPSVADRTAAPPASETATRETTATAPKAVNQQPQKPVAAASPPPGLEQFQKTIVVPQPAKKSDTSPGGNSVQPGNVNQPAASAGASALAAREQVRDKLAQNRLAQEQLAKDRLAEEKRKADIARKAELARNAELARKAEQARKAELARKAEQAKRDADLKRRMDEARRDDHAKSAIASSVTNTPRSRSIAPLRMQTAGAPRQPQLEAGGATAGNEIAMADRPVPSAPAVAAIAPGIPVAPRAVLISPPDHSVYWSLQRDGVIYRTNDRKSWTPQSTGVQAELLAGMATSDSVCWAVGRKGTILLTTDGVHWERINSPTGSDVIGITAASKDVATIFTAGGVTYSTFDGGSNWEQAN